MFKTIGFNIGSGWLESKMCSLDFLDVIKAGILAEITCVIFFLGTEVLKEIWCHYRSIQKIK